MSMKRCHRVGARWSLAALAVLSNACGKESWEHAAQQGTLRELTRAVAQDRSHGDFSAGKLRRLAQLVAERELAAATDKANRAEGEAVPVAELAPCARALKQALEKRADRGDDTAGAARLSLVTAGFPLCDSEWERLRTSELGWARAASARASSSSERWGHRDRALSDPDSRVRHAALQSVLLAPAEQHREALVNLLRRAPEPTSRELAAKALGILGGDATYRALSDAWPRADLKLRLAFVSAFAQARTFNTGGAEQLVALAQSEPGIVGVAAAASLAQGNTSAKAHGQARVTRALESGSVEEQRLAILAADWSLPEHSTKLLRLGLAGDAQVRVTALGRWLERPEHEWSAITVLREQSEPATSAALLARTRLAERNDSSVAPVLRAQLGYASMATRAQAASDLLRLGDYSAVARALVDDAPEVRLRTACLVLSRP